MKHARNFLDSFRRCRLFLKMMMYDIIFYISATASFLLGGYILREQMKNVDTGMLNQYILQRSADEIQLLNSQLKAFIAVFIFAVIGVIAAIILSWSLSRGLMYTEIMKKRLNWHYYKKFVGLNLIIAAAAALLLLVFSRFTELQWALYLFYAVILLFVYFTAMIYAYFTKKKQEIFHSIGQGLTLGIRKAKDMFLPSLLILIVFAVFSLINYGIQQVYPFKYMSLIFLLIVSAWSRPYFVSEAEKLM